MGAEHNRLDTPIPQWGSIGQWLQGEFVRARGDAQPSFGRRAGLFVKDIILLSRVALNGIFLRAPTRLLQTLVSASYYVADSAYTLFRWMGVHAEPFPLPRTSWDKANRALSQAAHDADPTSAQIISGLANRYHFWSQRQAAEWRQSPAQLVLKPFRLIGRAFAQPFVQTYQELKNPRMRRVGLVRAAMIVLSFGVLAATFYSFSTIAPITIGVMVGARGYLSFSKRVAAFAAKKEFGCEDPCFGLSVRDEPDAEKREAKRVQLQAVYAAYASAKEALQAEKDALIRYMHQSAMREGDDGAAYEAYAARYQELVGKEEHLQRCYARVSIAIDAQVQAYRLGESDVAGEACDNLEKICDAAKQGFEVIRASISRLEALPVIEQSVELQAIAPVGDWVEGEVNGELRENHPPLPESGKSMHNQYPPPESPEEPQTGRGGPGVALREGAKRPT